MISLSVAIIFFSSLERDVVMVFTILFSNSLCHKFVWLGVVRLTRWRVLSLSSKRFLLDALFFIAGC